jgi:hypothetical protein
VSPKTIREYVAAIRPRYQHSSRSEKSLILDEFCRTTNYHRKSALRLLNQAPNPKPSRRGRRAKYSSELIPHLKLVWEATNRLGSKRLSPFLPEIVSALERHGELELSPPLREQILSLSPATIDRLLAPYRLPARKARLREGKPNPFKSLVPVRTFGEWNEVKAGSMQADLVLHCGETTEGFHLTTLVMVDVACGWVECEAVWGKSKSRVGGALDRVRRRLPFPLRELHTDNGVEFLNEVIYPYCRQHGVTLSRGRAYKKNDQAYVEQKNWLLVRRVVGYDRYATRGAQEALNSLYRWLTLQANFYQPVRKLVEKQRQGAKVTKRYDRAQTPYQRLIASRVLETEVEEALGGLYQSLNPLQIQRQIEQGLEELWSLAEAARDSKRIKRRPASVPFAR